MRHAHLTATLLLAVFSLAAAPSSQLPEFELVDPFGNTYSNTDLLGRSVLLVVTAPTLANEEEQRGWSDRLADLIQSDEARVVFLQDLEPSWFEEMARERITEEIEPEKEPIVLLDPDGSVRRRFGVEEGETVILVYGAEGRLLHVEGGAPDAEAGRRIRKALHGDKEE
jgi:hypothetical protein